MSKTIVQYIVVRRDLQTVLGWPLGALMAQTAHASTAVLHHHKDDPHVQAYLEEVERMHKVVLEAPDLPALQTLAATLKERGIHFWLWTEQPENIPTALALKPYPRKGVKPLLQHLKLYS